MLRSCPHLCRPPQGGIARTPKQEEADAGIPEVAAVSGINRNLLAVLVSCRYLETATNVLFIGPPGVGKTHIATDLGLDTVAARYRTHFKDQPAPRGHMG